MMIIYLKDRETHFIFFGDLKFPPPIDVIRQLRLIAIRASMFTKHAAQNLTSAILSGGFPQSCIGRFELWF